MSDNKPKVVVILAAGLGSRLQSEGGPPKPLLPVAKRPLILRVLDRFKEALIEEAIIVLGHRGDEVRACIETAKPLNKLSFVTNPMFRMSNGLSVLAASEAIGDRPFFLSMADHIFDSKMIISLAKAELPDDGLVLAVDRKLHSIYDMDDATKVRTENNRIVEISKNLTVFDAVDTGLFACTPAILRAIKKFSDSRYNKDCTLSEGVHTLSKHGLALVHDIGDSLWQDVDTKNCAEHAEYLFGAEP